MGAFLKDHICLQSIKYIGTDLNLLSKTISMHRIKLEYNSKKLYITYNLHWPLNFESL